MTTHPGILMTIITDRAMTFARILIVAATLTFRLLAMLRKHHPSHQNHGTVTKVSLTEVDEGDLPATDLLHVVHPCRPSVLYCERIVPPLPNSSLV